MRVFWYAFMGLVISVIMFNVIGNAYFIDEGIMPVGIVLSTIISGCTGAIVSIIEETMGKDNKETNSTED